MNISLINILYPGGMPPPAEVSDRVFLGRPIRWGRSPWLFIRPRGGAEAGTQAKLLSEAYGGCFVRLKFIIYQQCHWCNFSHGAWKILGGVQRVVRVVFDVSLGERNRSPVHLLSNSFMCSCCPFCDLFATCNIIYKTRFDLFRNYKIQQIRAARGATRRTTKTTNYKIPEIPDSGNSGRDLGRRAKKKKGREAKNLQFLFFCSL